jgi:hypothetical protein
MPTPTVGPHISLMMSGDHCTRASEKIITFKAALPNSSSPRLPVSVHWMYLSVEGLIDDKENFSTVMSLHLKGWLSETAATIAQNTFQCAWQQSNFGSDIRGLTKNSPSCACRGSSGQKPQYGLMTLTYQVYYLEVLHENVRWKRPELFANNSWILHHDNAPAHTALSVREFFYLVSK